jgi:hypothetical protein
MSDESKRFSAFLRGETSDPVPKRETSKRQAFNDMLRALGTAHYDAAFQEYQAAQRREEQNREGSEGGKP